MSAKATYLLTAIARMLLMLSVGTLGATALHAQTSASNLFDQINAQIKKATDTVTATTNAAKTTTDSVTTALKPVDNATTKGAKASAAATAGAAAGVTDVPQLGPIEIDGFIFALRDCENIQGSGVTCHFHATNQQADRALQVAGGAASYIIDATGAQHWTQSVRLGTGAGSTMTVANVPVEGVIVFGGVDPGVTKIAKLHLLVTGGQFDWRDVPLVLPQQLSEANTTSGAAGIQSAGAAGAKSIEVVNKSGAGSGGPRLTNDDVAKLLKAGLAESTVIQMIDASSPAFDTSANGLIALKQAGVSDAVIQRIFTRQQAQTQTN